MSTKRARTPDDAAKALADEFRRIGQVFTLKDAAQLAGCSEDTLSRAIAEGDLRAGRPGGHRYRIPAYELAKWVLSGG